jgi:uncharacterized protein YgiM (DUF1202 family)
MKKKIVSRSILFLLVLLLAAFVPVSSVFADVPAGPGNFGTLGAPGYASSPLRGRDGAFAYSPTLYGGYSTGTFAPPTRTIDNRSYAGYQPYGYGYGYAYSPYFNSFASVAGTVTASSLNVRTGPSTSYHAITQISKGTKVIVIGKSGSWLQVLYSGNNFGYVHSKYISY